MRSNSASIAKVPKLDFNVMKIKLRKNEESQYQNNNNHYNQQQINNSHINYQNNMNHNNMYNNNYQMQNIKKVKIILMIKLLISLFKIFISYLKFRII